MITELTQKADRMGTVNYTNHNDNGHGNHNDPDNRTHNKGKWFIEPHIWCTMSAEQKREHNTDRKSVV